MSQISIKNTRGKELEEHLISIHLEPWSSRIKMSEEDFESNEYEMTFCPYCEKLLERPHWGKKYNGIRGRCKDCNVIWNLS